MIKMHRYTMTGSGEFPLDMLRYDRAFPDTQADVKILEAGRAPRRVTLVSYRWPTTERWRSFGWSLDGKVVKADYI